MQETVDIRKQLEKWNLFLSEEMIMVMTPIGLKSVPLADITPESSLKNSVRLHVVHSLRKKW
jgi:hypothetical protein